MIGEIKIKIKILYVNYGQILHKIQMNNKNN